MAILLLIRHGRTKANSTGVLAGRTAGVGLDEVGVRQVADLGVRLAPVPLAAVITSPLQRTVETAKALYGAVPESGDPAARPRLRRDIRLAEVLYGEWEGKHLSKLAKEPLWRTVQHYPSQVTFPGGESLRSVQARAVEAVREHDAAVRAEHGDDAIWAVVSHGDVIKSILADALGCHLDLFQRIAVDPASVSVVRYTNERPFVLRMNDSGVTLGDALKPAPPRKGRKRGSSDPRQSGTASKGHGSTPAKSDDAVVGGGSGGIR
jgi:probable phosphomutase (TIGR03848 family)